VKLIGACRCCCPRRVGQLLVAAPPVVGEAALRPGDAPSSSARSRCRLACHAPHATNVQDAVHWVGLVERACCSNPPEYIGETLFDSPLCLPFSKLFGHVATTSRGTPPGSRWDVAPRNITEPTLMEAEDTQRQDKLVFDFL
jgi:hypothetical protein